MEAPSRSVKSHWGLGESRLLKSLPSRRRPQCASHYAKDVRAAPKRGAPVRIHGKNPIRLGPNLVVRPKGERQKSSRNLPHYRRRHMSGRIYRGIIVGGRGLGVKGMSAPRMRRVLRRIIDFDFVPGTLNVRLRESFDEGLLESYVGWEELGRRLPDPEVPGRRGLRYGRVIIAQRFPGIAFQGDEPDYPADQVELISDRHIRQTLNLSDGDTIEFALVGSREGY